jgi:hypothetical protein
MANLSNDVNTVKTDASKVVSTVETDVSKVESEVVGFWDKTWTTKVLVLVAVAALVVGFVVGKV